jgi:hypothetical protein
VLAVLVGVVSKISPLSSLFCCRFDGSKFGEAAILDETLQSFVVNQCGEDTFLYCLRIVQQN